MYMMKVFLCVLTAGLWLFAPQAAEAAEPPVLMVSGSGKAEAAPDRATVAIGVVGEAKDSATAQKENARKAAAVQRALVAGGIPAANIRTHSYDFFPLYERQESGSEHEIAGYRVENTVTVRVDDIADVSRVIDLALRSGANHISSLDFGVKDTARIRKAAIHAAVEDARKQADELAAALGRRIVGLKSVSESMYPLTERSVAGKMRMAADAMSTPIAPGMLEMNVDVHIEYYLNE